MLLHLPCCGNRSGSWIRCADIARVAYLFLNGGVYIDTDMCVIWVARTSTRSTCRQIANVSCSVILRCTRLLGPVRLPDEVLCCTSGDMFVPCDDDGIIQNNFLAAPSRHPFLLWLLKVGCPGLWHLTCWPCVLRCMCVCYCTLLSWLTDCAYPGRPWCCMHHMRRRSSIQRARS